MNRQFELEISTIVKIEKIAAKLKMSFDDALVFLVEKVLRPTKAVSCCRKGFNTRARGCGCGCVGGDGADAAAAECSGIARVRAAEKAARAARRKAEHDAAVAASASHGANEEKISPRRGPATDGAASAGEKGSHIFVTTPEAVRKYIDPICSGKEAR